LQLLCSELHFYGKQRRSEQFAWLAGPGIYHGHLNLGTSPRSSPITHTLIAISYLFLKCLLFIANLDYAVQKTDAGFITHGSANHTHGGESNVESKWLLEYSKIFDNASTAKPCSLALTEFHFLLLSNNLLKVWCLPQVKYHDLFHCA
jgi:hypothetical protein